jgi:hypothetical protein
MQSGQFEGYDIRQVLGRSKMKGSHNRVVLFDKKPQNQVGRLQARPENCLH